jgi:hypothetical protein
MSRNDNLFVGLPQRSPTCVRTGGPPGARIRRTSPPDPGVASAPAMRVHRIAAGLRVGLGLRTGLGAGRVTAGQNYA